MLQYPEKSAQETARSIRSFSALLVAKSPVPVRRAIPSLARFPCFGRVACHGWFVAISAASVVVSAAGGWRAQDRSTGADPYQTIRRGRENKVCHTAKRFATALLLVVSASACAASTPTIAASSDAEVSADGDSGRTPTRVGPDGTWELATLTLDGELIPEVVGLFLEVGGAEFGADGACNSFAGPFDGDIFSTLAGCIDDVPLDRNAIDERMKEALSNGPDLIDNQLVFVAPGVELVYQPFDVPAVGEAFAVLGNTDLAADESELFIDPEAGPLVVDKLVRLEHPTTTAQFHLSTRGDLISLHWSTESAGGSWGGELRMLSRRGYAYELQGRSGPVGLRVALIPDTLVGAPELLALGVLENNVLVLGDGIASGEVEVARPDGGSFVLTIP